MHTHIKIYIRFILERKCVVQVKFMLEGNRYAQVVPPDEGNQIVHEINLKNKSADNAISTP